MGRSRTLANISRFATTFLKMVFLLRVGLLLEALALFAPRLGVLGDGGMRMESLHDGGRGHGRSIMSTGPSCSVPRRDTGDALICPNNPPSTLDEAISNGWRYAPIVKYHPLETHFMESPDVWFGSSTEYPAPGNGLNKAFRSQYGPDVSLDEASKRAENADTAFDSTGASTATVFFTVQEYAEDYWLYNYQLFFGWNGCSSQEYAVSNAPSSYLSYYMCPAGVHEGDLEIVSVLVCKSDLVSGPARIGYNQHGWSEVRNCGDGAGCPTEDGHPVVYAALGGHALYPENDAPFHVYYHTANLPVYVGDRTADGGRTFIPTQENVKFLPIIDGLPEDEVWDWARFGGNWGRIFNDSPPTTIQCFSDDGLSFVDCGADKSGVVAIITAGAALASESGPAQEQFMRGPLQRSPTYQIIGNKLPPVLESGDGFDLECPRDVAFGSLRDAGVPVEEPGTAGGVTEEASPSPQMPADMRSGAEGMVPVVEDIPLQSADLMEPEGSKGAPGTPAMAGPAPYSGCPPTAISLLWLMIYMVIILTFV